MKLNLPRWIYRNIHIQLEGDPLNDDITFTVECGPFIITITMTYQAFLQMLSEASKEMGDEWELVEGLLELLVAPEYTTLPVEKE